MALKIIFKGAGKARGGACGLTPERHKRCPETAIPLPDMLEAETPPGRVPPPNAARRKINWALWAGFNLFAKRPEAGPEL